MHRKRTSDVGEGSVCKPNAELELKVGFLRLQVDNEPALGVLRGDVRIIVQGLTDQPLRAHKFILASKSSVLCKMFDTETLEKETRIFRIDDTTLPVMRAVVRFCYTAEIEFTDEVTAEAVLEVAHKYELDLLRKLCVQDLTTTISEGNLPTILKLARRFESTGLEAAASQFFKDNFDEVISDVLGEFC
ncbi:unnamed protein product [Calypogeia fissa]